MRLRPTSLRSACSHLVYGLGPWALVAVSAQQPGPGGGVAVDRVAALAADVALDVDLAPHPGGVAVVPVDDLAERPPPAVLGPAVRPTDGDRGVGDERFGHAQQATQGGGRGGFPAARQ